jgi:hypothetical protein
MVTYIAVSWTFVSKQPAPYSNCIASLTPFSECSETIFGFFAGINATRYEQDLCLDLCYQDKLIGQCGCASLLIRTLNSTRYCQTDTEEFFKRAFDSVSSASHPDLLCEDVCRLQCECQSLTLRSASPSSPRRATSTRIRTRTPR